MACSPRRRRCRPGRRAGSTCSSRAPTARCGTSGSRTAGAAGRASAASSRARRPPSRGARIASTCSSRGTDSALWHKWWALVPTVRLHAKVLTAPNVAVATDGATDARGLRAAGIAVELASTENLNLPAAQRLSTSVPARWATRRPSRTSCSPTATTPAPTMSWSTSFARRCRRSTGAPRTRRAGRVRSSRKARRSGRSATRSDTSSACST